MAVRLLLSSFFLTFIIVFRARDAREIRYQTDLRVSAATLTYSVAYGNKIRKLWKVSVFVIAASYLA